MAATPFHALVRTARERILTELEDLAQTLLMTPNLSDTDGLVTALGKMLDSYEELVKATHTSSDVRYAFDDLPATEKVLHATTVHVIEVLERLRGA